MKKEHARRILIDHQNWRRGLWKYSEVWVHPKYTNKGVWEAIDAVIELLSCNK